MDNEMRRSEKEDVLEENLVGPRKLVDYDVEIDSDLEERWRRAWLRAMSK